MLNKKLKAKTVFDNIKSLGYLGVEIGYLICK